MLCRVVNPNLAGWDEAPATTIPRGSNRARKSPIELDQCVNRQRDAVADDQRVQIDRADALFLLSDVAEADQHVGPGPARSGGGWSSRTAWPPPEGRWRARPRRHRTPSSPPIPSVSRYRAAPTVAWSRPPTGWPSAALDARPWMAASLAGRCPHRGAEPASPVGAANLRGGPGAG